MSQTACGPESQSHAQRPEVLTVLTPIARGFAPRRAHGGCSSPPHPCRLVTTGCRAGVLRHIIGRRMARKTRIALIGGGIGGCTAAHALLQKGFDVHAYEAQPELKEIGAGVALGPNAMKALRALGLEQAVRDVAYQGEYQYLLSWQSGRVISKNARLDAEKRYGAAGCSVHRADLLDVLSGEPAERGRQSGCARRRGRHSRERRLGEIQGRHRDRGRRDRRRRRHPLGGARRVCSARTRRASRARSATAASSRSTPFPVPPVQEGTWLGPHGAIVIYRVRRGELINVVAHHDDDTYRHESWITECDRQEPIERYASGTSR